jgi:lipoyl-dependent peroxiredoxin subunit D
VSGVEDIRAALPEAAKDLKLNLQNVLTQGALTEAQRWGVALSVAFASRNEAVQDALLADAREAVSAEVIEDAYAAAALMAMNNVYYRFRHFIHKESYEKRPAKLRMQRIAKPATNKADFELFCLAVSAVNGCEMCVRSHEEVVRKHDLTEEQVHDAVRAAATVFAVAVAHETAPQLTAG